MRSRRQILVAALMCVLGRWVPCDDGTVLAANGRGPRVHVRIAGGLPEPDSDSTRWRIVALVRCDDADLPKAMPKVEISGGRLMCVRPTHAAIPVGGSALFFLHVEAAETGRTAEMTFRLAELPESRTTCRLSAGVDLSALKWKSWWAGKDVHVDDVQSPPAGAAKWQPVILPGLWQDLGVTWVRTRFVVPSTWRDMPLRIKLRAVDDNEATFLNGREIGRTKGWDLQRDYPIPADAVRWGQTNELYIAVDNVNAGGGIYRGPLLITVGDAPETSWPFKPAVLQPEAQRAKPGPIGPRLPLRRMTVRNGVLHYADGGEVALWGVNVYPQSWTQYNTLAKLGVDHKRSIDEDFEDLVQAGIEIIRIHVFDTEISGAGGKLVRNHHLDLLDYLVAQCNKHSIYLMLTPIAWWGSPNQRPDSVSRNTPKQAMSLWPGSWPAQANYLREFLTHKNPYTDRRLVDEPCLVLFEVINEPTYWSYGDVIGGRFGRTHLSADVSRRGIQAVRDAWRGFLPSKDWENPATFACYRYDTVRRYIDAMINAIRGTGARQPIAYSTFASHDVEIAQAVADSRCDAITLGAYPGGLGLENDHLNQLGATKNGALDSRFARKARLVYEFDAAGMVRQVCMYPAMARRWRNLGVQVACQFQYDARATAHVNWDWPTHYLNLWHTPGKMVSFLIGGEAFRRIPRGAVFPTPADDQVFAPAATSFHRNAALLCADDCYMQTGPTDWRPLALPRHPKRIMSVGACPYFDYDGTGVIDLRIDGNRAALRVYPDVERLRNDLRGTIDKPLTRLHERSHAFRLLLSDWTDAKVIRLKDWRQQQVPGSAGRFAATPGTYQLRK